MAKETVFYPREEYDLIIRTLNEPDQVIAKILGIEPSYVTRNPSEVKVYHAVIRENEEVLGEVTIVGIPNDTSTEENTSSFAFVSESSENSHSVKTSLERILDLDKIKVIK